ncbi:MAG TPA: acyltransferase [Phenylobacterium sp.]|jgi:exopolysaccharide production protein ExoZ|nr:acyltransferase [Phenylobacterium sp.]
MKIWSLQALRFWAALGVVFFHSYVATLQMSHRLGMFGEAGAAFGRVGVDVFFVLSGVIITLTSQGLTAGEFMRRRALRILPIYGLLTVVYLTAGAFYGGVGWREAFTSLTLWPALDRIVEPRLQVAWTLCFEMLFYAATALVLWRRKLVWLVLAVFAAALAIRSGPVLRYVGNPIIIEFLMGVALARLPKWRGAVAFIPVGLAVIWVFGTTGYPLELGVTDFLNGTMAWRRVLLLGLPAALIVWGALQIDVRQGLLTYLGDASYSLYLTHLPVVVSVAWVLCRYTSAPPDAVAIVAAAASILLAWRFHELFEKPMLAWFRRPREAGVQIRV